MKAIETLLAVFLTMALGTLASSIAKLVGDEMLSFQSILFGIFFVSLRIKIFLDDLDYSGKIYRDLESKELSERQREKIQNDFTKEFFVGIFTWLLWIVAAFLISRCKFFHACITIFIAILFATIDLKFISQMKDKLKDSFIKYNSIYMFLLILSGLTSSRYHLISNLMMCGLIGFVLSDYCKHKSLNSLFKLVNEDCQTK